MENQGGVWDRDSGNVMRQYAENKQLATLNELKQMKQSMGLSTKNLDKIQASSSSSGTATTSNIAQRLRTVAENGEVSGRKSSPHHRSSSSQFMTSQIDSYTLGDDNAMNEDELRAEILKVTRERDMIIEEKREWVRMLQAKSESLEHSLEDISGKKEIIISYIKEIQEDKFRRDAINRGDQNSSEVIDDLLIILKDETLFSPRMRSSIPAPRIPIAEEIQTDLESYIPRIMAYHLDIVDEVRTLVEQIQDAYQNQEDESVEALIMKLQEVSYRGPDNFKTVKGVIESLTNLALGDLSKIEQQEGGEIDVNAQLTDITILSLIDRFVNQIELKSSIEGMDVSSEDVWREILCGRVTDPVILNEALSNLFISNENLKNKLKKYSSRNAKLRNQINATALRSDEIDVELSDENRNFDDIKSLDPVEAYGIYLIRLFELWNTMFESVHASSRNIIWSLLLSHVQKIVSGHPLTSKLPVIYVHAVVSEVAMNTRGIVGKFVSDALGSGIDFFNNSSDMSVVIDKIIKTGELELIVKRCLQNVVVHHEIICLITLMFSYLNREYSAEFEEFAMSNANSNLSQLALNTNTTTTAGSFLQQQQQQQQSPFYEERVRSLSTQSVSSVSRSEYNMSLMKSPTNGNNYQSAGGSGGAIGGGMMDRGRRGGQGGDGFSPEEKDITRLVPQKDLPSYMRPRKSQSSKMK